MKGYPFVRYAVALMLGILAYVALPNGVWLPLMAAGMGGILLGWGYWQHRQQVLKPIQFRQGLGVMLLLSALGWGSTWLHTPARQPNHIGQLTQPLTAYEGVVTTQPEERTKTYRVELTLRRALVEGRWQPLSGRVITYLDKTNTPLPRYGEVWLVGAPPRPIDPPLNPGEFNYQQFLAYKGIDHQQYLRPYQRRILGLSPPNRLTALAIQTNQFADSVLTHHLGNRAEYGLVNAMVLGVRDDLDTEQYRAYAAAGAVHILSVSGLHVGILFFVLTWVLGKLAPSQRKRVWVAMLKLALLWFYALMTGFSAPVLRSAAMFSILIVADASGRPHNLPNTLGVSAFFLLCFDPYTLFSAGLQLSYLAVMGIGAWMPYLNQWVTFRYVWLNRLWQLTAVALVAQLATFPLGVFYFHQFPTYFLLANPVVILASELLLPLAMATLAFCWVPGLSAGLGWLTGKVAWLLNEAVGLTGQLPGAAWEGLWLSAAGLVLLYALILAGVTALQTRRPVWLWGVACLSLLLAVLTIGEEISQRRHRQLAVHFLPHRTALSLTYGHRATLLTDADFQTDPRSFDFYLKNTFGRWGVAHLTTHNLRQPDTLTHALWAGGVFRQTPAYTLWVWQGKRILIINRLSGDIHWRLPAVVDYCIIRRNALHEWSQLRGRVVARHILFDDSNKTPLTDRLLAEAKQRGIACYSVRQQGAYVTELE